MRTSKIIQGDCLATLRTLADESVHCCVTSPPYWGLRDYGHERQIGLEDTPEAYVARMVEVFREVRRVLRKDGTLWLNLGDSYARNGGSGRCGPNASVGSTKAGVQERNCKAPNGYKAKDLVGIPWRVAFALQDDGWWLRQDIIWHKPNPMPESVRDRCTKAHEYVFLMTKNERYYYDAEAISEATAKSGGMPRQFGASKQAGTFRQDEGRVFVDNGSRNRRSVWTITTKPYSGAHFAVMPTDLVKPCILAGCPEGGTVLDPFAGSGTTLAVAAELGCNGIGCELNPEYIKLAEQRIAAVQPLLF